MQGHMMFWRCAVLGPQAPSESATQGGDDHRSPQRFNNDALALYPAHDLQIHRDKGDGAAAGQSGDPCSRIVAGQICSFRKPVPA
jgi:hypothetical protein